MKRCRFCGAELPEGAHFCHHCARSQLRKRHSWKLLLGRKGAALLAAACLVGMIGLFLPRIRREVPQSSEEAAQASAEADIPAETTLPKERRGPGTPPTEFVMSDRTKNFHTSLHVLHEYGSGYECTAYKVGSVTIAERYTAPDGSESEQIYYPIDAGLVPQTRTVYTRAADGSESYSEWNLAWRCTLVLRLAPDGTGELSTFDEEGNQSSHGRISDGAAYLDSLRLRVEDAVEEYRQQLIAELAEEAEPDYRLEIYP